MAWPPRPTGGRGAAARRVGLCAPGSAFRSAARRRAARRPRRGAGRRAWWWCGCGPGSRPAAARPAIVQRLGRVGQHRLVDAVGHQRGGADRFQAQVVEGIFAGRVVDAGDHAGHVEHQLGDLGGHDVRVVRAGQGQEDVGLLDAGALQHVFVYAGADHGGAVEIGIQPLQRLRAQVDHRHLVALAVKLAGQAGAHPPTAHDHNFHVRSFPRRASMDAARRPTVPLAVGGGSACRPRPGWGRGPPAPGRARSSTHRAGSAPG